MYRCVEYSVVPLNNSPGGHLVVRFKHFGVLIQLDEAGRCDTLGNIFAYGHFFNVVVAAKHKHLFAEVVQNPFQCSAVYQWPFRIHKRYMSLQRRVMDKDKNRRLAILKFLLQPFQLVLRQFRRRRIQEEHRSLSHACLTHQLPVPGRIAEHFGYCGGAIVIARQYEIRDFCRIKRCLINRYTTASGS